MVAFEYQSPAIVGMYSEGQGDSVSRLITGINRVTMWVIGFVTYLLSAPDPPSTIPFNISGMGIGAAI